MVVINDMNHATVINALKNGYSNAGNLPSLSFCYFRISRIKVNQRVEDSTAIESLLVNLAEMVELMEACETTILPTYVI